MVTKQNTGNRKIHVALKFYNFAYTFIQEGYDGINLNLYANTILITVGHVTRTIIFRDFKVFKKSSKIKRKIDLLMIFHFLIDSNKSPLTPLLLTTFFFIFIAPEVGGGGRGVSKPAGHVKLIT